MYTIHLKSISSCRLEFRAGHRKLTPYMDMLIRILQRIFFFSPTTTKIPNEFRHCAASFIVRTYIFTTICTTCCPFYCSHLILGVTLQFCLVIMSLIYLCRSWKFWWVILISIYPRMGTIPDKRFITHSEVNSKHWNGKSATLYLQRFSGICVDLCVPYKW